MQISRLKTLVICDSFLDWTLHDPLLESFFVKGSIYALQLLADTGLLASKPALVPMDPLVKLSRDSDQPLLDPSPYRALVGRLLYLTITRPYITFSVHYLSQFMAAPTDVQLTAAHCILRYIKNNPGQGMFYSPTSDVCLNVFVDYNWAT